MKPSKSVYNKLLWFDKLELLDPIKHTVWASAAKKLIPTEAEADAWGLWKEEKVA